MPTVVVWELQLELGRELCIHSYGTQSLLSMMLYLVSRCCLRSCTTLVTGYMSSSLICGRNPDAAMSLVRGALLTLSAVCCSWPTVICFPGLRALFMFWGHRRSSLATSRKPSQVFIVNWPEAIAGLHWPLVESHRHRRSLLATSRRPSQLFIGTFSEAIAELHW